MTRTRGKHALILPASSAQIANMWVIAKNAERRHLTSSQKAIVAVKAEELISRLEAAAKERQREHEGTAPGRGKSLSQLVDEVIDDKNTGKVTHHLARVFSTNRQYVCDAGKGRALETFRAKAYWVPKFVQ